MGIKLVEEVMDHAPDALTAGEWKGLIVLARDANEKTRLTYSKINDPEILRRVRLSIPAWSNLRSALIRKGVLEVVEAGVKGRSARYRIPVMDPRILHLSDEDPESGEEMLHPVDEASGTTLHPTDEASAGFFIQQMTLTPPCSSTTSSSAPTAPPATGDTEGGGGGDQQQEAEAFLQSLPSPWTAGRKTARDLAPLLLERITEQGWQLDGELTKQLTDNPGGVNRFASVLKSRIDDLPKKPTAKTRASPPVRPMPPWCQHLDCDEITRRRTTEDTDGHRSSSPCRACHPDYYEDQAA